MYGAELAPNRWYHFVAECKAAVFSWEGCEIEMSTKALFSFSFRFSVSFQRSHGLAELERKSLYVLFIFGSMGSLGLERKEGRESKEGKELLSSSSPPSLLLPSLSLQV